MAKASKIGTPPNWATTLTLQRSWRGMHTQPLCGAIRMRRKVKHVAIKKLRVAGRTQVRTHAAENNGHARPV
jgi:hypothetical protein